MTMQTDLAVTSFNILSCDSKDNFHAWIIFIKECHV